MRKFFNIAGYASAVIVLAVIAVAAITAVLYGMIELWKMVMA